MASVDSKPADAIRIRARLKNGMTEVHVLMPHPMETGFRKDDQGRPIPPHYITDVGISVEGRPVLSARMGIAIAQDPLLSFRFRNGRPGDRIAVSWVDNLGGRGAGEALIT